MKYDDLYNEATRMIESGASIDELKKKFRIYIDNHFTPDYWEKNVVEYDILDTLHKIAVVRFIKAKRVDELAEFLDISFNEADRMRNKYYNRLLDYNKKTYELYGYRKHIVKYKGKIITSYYTNTIAEIEKVLIEMFTNIYSKKDDRASFSSKGAEFIDDSFFVKDGFKYYRPKEVTFRTKAFYRYIVHKDLVGFGITELREFRSVIRWFEQRHKVRDAIILRTVLKDRLAKVITGIRTNNDLDKLYKEYWEGINFLKGANKENDTLIDNPIINYESNSMTGVNQILELQRSTKDKNILYEVRIYAYQKFLDTFRKYNYSIPELEEREPYYEDIKDKTGIELDLREMVDPQFDYDSINNYSVYKSECISSEQAKRGSKSIPKPDSFNLKSSK